MVPFRRGVELRAGPAEARLYAPGFATPRSRLALLGHRATTAHFSAVYPLFYEEGLGFRGQFVGDDLYGGAFHYDPFIAYEDGHVTSPNMVILGLIGSAKSALVKTLLRRGEVWRRRAFVVDTKPEYGPLARAMGVEPVIMSPGGGVCINPVSREISEPEQQLLLEKIGEALLRRPLKAEERAALIDVVRLVRERAGASEPTLPDVVRLLFDPPAEVAAGLYVEPAFLARKTWKLATALRLLCTAPGLRGMFDGPTTANLDLDGPLVVLDISALKASAGELLPIAMAIAMAWLRAAAVGEGADRSVRAASGLHALHLSLVLDEAWLALAVPAVADFVQQSFKYSRQTGWQNIVVFHRLSDVLAAADQGTRHLHVVRGLVADAETRVIYRQPPDEIPELRRAFHLTDTQCELAQSLPRARGLWLVGQRPFLIDHRRGPDEIAFTLTDQGMLGSEEPAELAQEEAA
jgi:hypothetical protein